MQLKFDLPLSRRALITDLYGWKKYPIIIDAVYSSAQHFDFEVNVVIDYSSTCPCSMALSKRHIRDQFIEKYKDHKMVDQKELAQWLDDEGISAVPHGQRSKAFVKLINPKKLDFVQWIDQIENVLITATQTAVKRLDEQKFAQLSANNTMFAEDAARRVSKLLCSMNSFEDFELEVYHYESLHSHDAYAKASSATIKKHL